MGDLYSKTYYTAPYSYVQSTFIREYDIEKANVNALIMNGIIKEEEYPWWCSIIKNKREVLIGKKAKVNRNIAPIILDTIKEARKRFIDENNIPEEKILEIRNDALYIIDDIPACTMFDRMNFVMKNIYTSYYQVTKPRQLKLYYYLDRINNIETLDVSGIGDETIERYHNEYMMDFLKTLFYSIETEPLQDALTLLKDFYMNYINGSLDIGYYRQFSPSSTYDTIYHTSVGRNQYQFITNPSSIDVIDKNYNLIFIQELYKLVSTIYFNTHQ